MADETSSGEMSMFRKWKLKFITTPEYFEYQAQQQGLKTYAELRDFQAQQKGFKNYAEYYKTYKHNTGKQRPLAEAKDCGAYLGIYIAEKIIERIFRKGAQRMPINNPGYDFLCPKKCKIDVKSSVLRLNMGETTPFWAFIINKNKIADYFLLLGFDNRVNLEPKKIWLIKGKEEIPYIYTIRGKKSRILNAAGSLYIYNSIKYINSFAKYEQHDKLDRAVACCERFAEHEKEKQER